MTPSMRVLWSLFRTGDGFTARQLEAATGYPPSTVAGALAQLKASGRIHKAAKICRGAGRGSGAPQAIYALSSDTTEQSGKGAA